jgi:hypothetical protein
MSLSELTKLLNPKPKCMHCKVKYAKLGMFCSQKCHAAEAIARFPAADFTWCQFHEEWHHRSEIKDCEEAIRLSF